MKFRIPSNPIFVIVKNVGALTAARFMGRLLNFVVVAIVARTLGAEGLGGYATANAIASFALIFADIGLAPRLLRESAAHPSTTLEVYAGSMAIKTVTTLLLGVGLAVLYFILPYESWVRDLTVLTSISWIVRSYSNLNHSILRARERMEIEALSVTIQSLIFIACAASALYLGYSIVAVGWASIFASAVQLVVSSVMARRFSPLGFDWRPDFETMRSAAPYTATLVANAAFAQSNVIVLSLVAGQVLVGEYTSVSRILILMTIVPQLITLAIVPASARVFAQADAARYRRLTTGSLRVVLILAGAAGVALIGFAKLLLGVIYGEELVGLYPYLQIGTLYLVFCFASGALGSTLTASGRQRQRARAIMLALVFSVVLVLALTPLFGVAGAVMALVLAEGVLVLAQWIAARDLMDGGDVFRNLVAISCAAAPSVAAHFGLVHFGFPIASMIVPPLLYVIVLVPFGEPKKLYELVVQRG